MGFWGACDRGQGMVINFHFPDLFAGLSIQRIYVGLSVTGVDDRGGRVRTGPRIDDRGRADAARRFDRPV